MQNRKRQQSVMLVQAQFDDLDGGDTENSLQQSFEAQAASQQQRAATNSNVIAPPAATAVFDASQRQGMDHSLSVSARLL